MAEIFINLIGSLQEAGNLLETEHAIIMLLVLFGLLTFNQRPLSRFVPVIILAGMALSVFTPVHTVELLWPVISALVVPPIIWGAALAVARSGPLRRGRSLLIWLLVMAGVAISLFYVSQKPLGYALLIGSLAVTLVWYLRELTVERSLLSTLGLIALAVLLLEIDVAVVSPRPWVGTLIAGVAFGLAVGFTGVTLYRRLSQPVWRGYFWVLAYLAYLIGLLFGVSPIASTLAAALAVAAYGYSTRLWPSQADLPAPGQTTLFFILGSSVWLLLGWQAHIEVSTVDLSGIAVAMLVITLGILVIRNQVPLDGMNRWLRLLRKEVRVLLLLMGASFYWPKEAALTALNVEIALAAAVLLIFSMREAIKPIFELFGIKLSWPSDESDETSHGGKR
jgi:hypothetical protein